MANKAQLQINNIVLNDYIARIQELKGIASELPDGNDTTSTVIQRKVGTFTTDSNGAATVDCGFQPDVVYIQGDREYVEAAGGYLSYSAAALFAEESRDNPTTYMASDGGLVIMVWEKTSTGFTIAAVNMDYSWNESTTRTTYNYVAVKYTGESDSGTSSTAKVIVPNTTQYGTSAWRTSDASVNASNSNTIFTMTANPNTTTYAYTSIDVSAYSTMKIVGTYSDLAGTSSQLQLNVGLFQYNLVTGYQTTVQGGNSGTINQTYDISQLSGVYNLGVTTVQGNSSGIHQTTVTITSIELY